MDKYKGVDCPICGKPLDNGEQVVICPDCGAPYHRDCILKQGKCIFDDLHKEGKHWQKPKTEYEKQAENMESRRCSRCGTLNDSNLIFCEVCGTMLTNNENAKNYENTYKQTQQPINFMQYDPYSTPFGGVDADDSINEIPVKDWAIYIGQNTSYFIPKFKRMSLGEKISTFNFASAFFGGFYYLYRKMYLWGVLLILINIVISLPSFFIRYASILYEIDSTNEYIAMFSNENMITVSNICGVISIVIMVLTGFFTNKLYRIHCKKNIDKISSLHLPREEYVQKLSAKGGTSKKLLPILLISYLIISFVSSIIILLITQ